MSADAQLPELFARAAELAGEERERFLADLASRDPAAAREVAELLAAAPVGPFAVDTPAWERLAEDPPPPERIGPYRILREIGRGGMGRVYLAEETREAFRRQVALKVLDRPSLGDEGLRRFRDEVRILASLEHPGIARFLDGGPTEQGVWYLALEYVEGDDLIAYARRRALTIDERVRLFLGVVEAVAFAHSRQIVHRDLKPGNVMVGADGRARLLDFGISKLVAPDDLAATRTRTELRAFTPAYASPEQFRGERVTPASDVFSLGVVLYELLSGARPFGGPPATPAAVEHAVLDEEPDPPSTAARRAAAAEGRRLVAGRGRGRLGPDLDAVCLKALRKDPAARYRSAAELAADLDRYLNGEAVEARHGNLRYRLGRPLRRHRSAIAAALAAGVVVAGAARLWNARGAWMSPAPAPAPAPFPLPWTGKESAESLAARFAASPESIEAGAALVTALLREGRPLEAESVLGRLHQLPSGADDPLVNYVEGSIAINRDQPQRALSAFSRALAGAEASGRGELVARIRGARGRTLDDLGRTEEAIRDLELARRAAEAAGDASTLAAVLNDLALHELRAGRYAAGEELLDRALAAARASGDAVRSGAMLVNLAGIATARGHPDRAVPRLRQAVALYRSLDARNRLGFALSELGAALDEVGERQEAATVYVEAVEVLEASGDASMAAFTRCRVAQADLRAGRLEESEAAIASIQEVAAASGLLEGLACSEQLAGEIAAARGELSQARAHFEEAHRLFVENGEPDAAADVLGTAAATAALAGDSGLGAEWARRAAEPFRDGGEHYQLYRSEVILAWSDALAGKPAAAEDRLAKVEDGDRRAAVTDRLLYRKSRAAVAAARGDRATARAQLGRAVREARGAGREREAAALERALETLAMQGG